MKTVQDSELHRFFEDGLRSAMKNQKVSANPHSVTYVADVLTRFMDAKHFFAKDEQGKARYETLAQLYGEYLHGTPEVKQQALKRLGDFCLMVSGFFPDSLNRKLVDVDYYMGMGGTAYGHLSQVQISALTAKIFLELSTKFRSFAEVIGEISDKAGVQSNSDLLRLYERWLLTGSDRLKTELSKHGIAAPFSIDPKVKH